MYPSALGGGTLFVEDGCIRMGVRKDSSVVVWPYGFSLRRRDGEILILNTKRKVEARAGDEVRIGGGQITQDEAGRTPEAARRNFGEARQEAGVPDQCRGPLWAASPVVSVTGEG